MNELMNLSDASQNYCSFDAQTPEGKALLFRAINNPDVRLKSMVNKNITIKDIFAREVSVVNDETGEVEMSHNVVFIDTQGVSYTATAKGIFNATKNLLQIFGSPATWEKPITVTIKEVAVAKGFMLTFDIV